MNGKKSKPKTGKSATDNTALGAETALPAEIAAETAATAAPPGKKTKSAKIKVVRDSFSFPEQDYRKISELKKICLAAGLPVKKSEILRAGLNLLSRMNAGELKQTLENVEKIKTGRPSAGK